jgi:hypothetical protein
MVFQTDYVCPLCDVNHLKDHEVGGDYDEDGVLKSYCPSCGRMYKIYLSRNNRRAIAIRLAMRCNLDFEKTKTVLQEAPQVSFIDYIKRSLDVIREDILTVVDWKRSDIK